MEMSSGGIALIVMAACTAAVLIVRAIASGVVRMQELKMRSGAGLYAGAEDARLQRIEQSLEAIAVEVERIAENQRYTTKLLTESTGGTPPSTKPAGVSRRPAEN